MKKILRFCLAFIALGLSNPTFAISLTLTTPKDAAKDVKITGTILLMFDEDVKAGSGDCTLNGEVLTANITSKYVKFPYAGLSYSTDYIFEVPAGAITDKSGKAFEGVSLHFRTMDRPEIAPHVFDFIVDPNATPVSGKVGQTMKSAIDALPKSNSARYYVYIKNGTYKEHFVIEANKQNISFIGENRDSVIIESNYGPVIQVLGNDIYMENFTVKGTNNPDYTQYNHAIFTEGKKNIYKNMLFLGHQDTHRTGGDRHYLKDCEIHGTIDFIYGSGNVFLDNCLIYLEPRNKMMLNATTWDTACVIAAGSHEMSQVWGTVFNHCTIDGDPSNDGRYSLGRPWHNACRAVYINTTMNIKPFSFGWTSMGNPPTLYAEYGSVDAQGNAIDLSQRTNRYIFEGDTITAGFNPVLTAEEAARYTLKNVLSGDDAWKPDEICANPACVVPSIKDNVISWERIPYSLCYIIRKDGKVIDFSSETSYPVSEYGNYSIQTVSEYGFTSEEATVLYADPAGITPNNIGGNISFFVKDGALHLSDKNLCDVKVCLFDLCGKKLLEGEISGNGGIVLPLQGLYLIKAEHKGICSFSKIMM